MKIVCAWCGRDTDEKDGKGMEGILGICRECVVKLEARRVVNYSTWPRLNILVQYFANQISPN